MDDFIKRSPNTERRTAQHQAVADDPELDYPEEDDYEDESSAPSLEKLKSSCWICESALRLPPPEFCMYATHCHPHLQVPACSLCTEAVLYVEPDTCWGCSNDTDAVLVCCSDCDKEFCTDCVAKAIGHYGAVQELLDGTTDDWKCLACQPPDLLLTVMQSLNDSDEASVPRTFELVVSELQLVEEDRKACLETLDEEQAQLQLFRKELGAEGEALDALYCWKQLHLDHEKRLLDKISNLQDELGVSFGFKDMASLYETLGLTARRRNHDDGGADSDHDDNDPEPEYVRTAAKAIRRREKEERPEGSPVTTLAKAVYKRDDCYSDVEELASDDEDDAPDTKEKEWRKNSGFRTSNVTASRQDIAEALQSENRRLDTLKRKQPSKTFRPADDKQAVRNEEREVTAGSGARPVRRDAYRVLVARSKTKQPGRSTLARHSSNLEPKPNHAEAFVSVKSGLYKVDAEKVHLQNQEELPPNSQESAASWECAASSQSQQSIAASENSTAASLLPLKKKRRLTASGSLCLCRKGRGVVRTVSVTPALAKKLKPHQLEGIGHMWQNTFVDMERHLDGNPSAVGGCVLAHCMGLGKSLSSIALLYTVLTSPSMLHSETGDPLMQTVLIVVPSNTIANWNNEFQKWTGELMPPLVVDSIINHNSPMAQDNALARWHSRGGVFLVTEGKFISLLKRGSTVQPDILVIDEAHCMLKTTTSKTFEALSTIETPRRVLLTGSPFQNNLMEYFRMISFIRPNVFPGVSKESDFDALYMKPIQEGEASDATEQEVYSYLRKTKEINALVAPFVHRKDASVLREVLPPLQQVVLHVRQSKLQSRLYRGYERLRKRGDEHEEAKSYNNFLRTYHDTRLLHNHPGCLLTANAKANQRSSSKSAKVPSPPKVDWWRQFLRPGDEEQLLNVDAGYKMILLLHILVASIKQNDKVLIFSESLQTLDFVERVLAYKNWHEHVPTITMPQIDQHFGGWKRDQDYLRIDGSTSSEDRGILVDLFNSPHTKNGSTRVNAFLISTLAGGVGINLTGANRVILMDSHFNPSVPTQALFRSYRYGQTKPCFVYRLLTEGSIEQKIYNRSVMKNGLALRVIDDKSFNRSFTKSELADLTTNLTWVQCETCSQWRVLLEGWTGDLPDKWYCDMNSDQENNSCAQPERLQIWYERRIHGMTMPTEAASPLKCMAFEDVDSSMTADEKQALVDNDPVLQELLEVEMKHSKVISRYYFHDALLASSKNTEQELESARKAAQSATKPIDSSVVTNLERSAFADEQLDMLAKPVGLASPAANATKLSTESVAPNADAIPGKRKSDVFGKLAVPKEPKMGEAKPVRNGSEAVGDKPLFKEPAAISDKPLVSNDEETTSLALENTEERAYSLDRAPVVHSTLEATECGSPKALARFSLGAKHASVRGRQQAVEGTAMTSKPLTDKKRIADTLQELSDSSCEVDESPALPKKPTFRPVARSRPSTKRSSTGTTKAALPRKRRARSQPAKPIPTGADVIDLLDSDSE